MSPQEGLRNYWHPVSWASELDGSPISTVLLGERVVLWRDAGGHPIAGADQCPHRGTALSLGTVDGRGCIVCPYHGWTFDPSGACTRVPQLPERAPIPGRANLPLYSCEEQYGLVWVCLGEPAADIPPFPEWWDRSYHHVACRKYTWRTSAGRMVENFTDVGHRGYLHGRQPEAHEELVVPAHRVEEAGDELHYTVATRGIGMRDEHPAGRRRGERGTRIDSYVLSLPYTVRLQCSFPGSAMHRTVFFAAQPHGDGESTGYCYQSRNFDLDADDTPFARFQEVLAEHDRPIVESQLPMDVPLDDPDELHLPFDRVAVAYRRALRRLLDGPPVAAGTGPLVRA